MVTLDKLKIKPYNFHIPSLIRHTLWAEQRELCLISQGLLEGIVSTCIIFICLKLVKFSYPLTIWPLTNQWGEASYIHKPRDMCSIAINMAYFPKIRHHVLTNGFSLFWNCHTGCEGLRYSQSGRNDNCHLKRWSWCDCGFPQTQSTDWGFLVNRVFSLVNWSQPINPQK